MNKLWIVLFAIPALFAFANCSPTSFSGDVVASAVGDPVDNELIVDDPTNGQPCPEDCKDRRHDDHDYKTDFYSFHSRCTKNTCPTPTPRPTPTPKPDCKCQPVEKAKVLVNVNHIELLPDGVIVPVPADTVVDLLTLDSEGFKFGPLPSASTVSEIRLVLNDFGNKIITPGNTEVKLTTPSPMNTAIKLVLPSAVPLEAGKSYLVQATFDPNSPIVRKDGNCVLQVKVTVTAIQEALD